MEKQVDLEGMREAVQKRVSEEAAGSEKVDVDPGSGRSGIKSGGPPVDPGFIKECLEANQLGDGILYATLHEGKFIYNKTSAEWLRWSGHHWETDDLDQSLAAVDNVCAAYLKEASDIVQQIAKISQNGGSKEQINQLRAVQGRIYKRIYSLRGETRRSSALKFAHTNQVKSLAIKGDELDCNPWVLPCKNGVIDLRTAEIRDGIPEDYLMKASPVEWQGIDAPAPVWGKTLNEIFEEDQEVIQYVGRLFGYGLTGLTQEHVLPVLSGQGRNGKGTIVETISRVMGPLASPIQAEMLLDQGRTRSSAGASPDIMALRGLRFAFASETDEGRRFSPSRVKWLSGGDTLVGRAPYDRREVKFTPTHLLMLLTNHKPHAPAHDFAFWERVHLIPFRLSFVDRAPQKDNERRADKTLNDRLLSEAPGILAWMVRGCIEWQQKGLAPPEVIREATQEYKRDEDLLGDFIDACCHVAPDARVGASELYDAFKEWFEENVSKKGFSQRKFGKLMKDRFEKVKSGTYYYQGLRLLSGLSV